MVATIMNQGGNSSLSSTPDSSGALRGNNQPTNSAADAANDNQYSNDARERFRNGDQSGARNSVNNIKDPALRLKMLRILWDEKADQSPPASLLRDGSGGLSDPLSLFFMMIYYMNKQVKQIDWSDILKTAAKNSNQKFSNLEVTTAFLPQSTPQSTDPLQTSRNGIQTQLNNSQRTNSEAQRDAERRNSPTTNPESSSDTFVQVWPIQNMPIIGGGISKSVGWDAGKINATTFAEPIISVNSGAEHIECDVEFTYAVGVAGLKDCQSATSSNGGFDQSAENVWTAEEVMGIMYLATSLVYPFESASIIGSKVQSADAVKSQSDGKDKSPQFPVVFMRHYSLFPFLTPFVVKSVKIEPDEQQPLIITEPTRLSNKETHLTFPAVRQVVKITISLISAHYYVTMFTEANGNEIQKQTSGKTYHAVAQTLLGRKGL